MSQYDDIMMRLRNTKPVSDRDPFVEIGEHDLVLLTLEPFTHTTHGPSARANFEVLASPVHPVGSRVTKIWLLCKPAAFATQTNDADRFVDFMRKMKGAPDGYDMTGDIAAVLRDRVGEQLMRGMVIHARGAGNISKNERAKALAEHREPKPFVDVVWSPIAQSAADIAGRRAQLDAKANAAPPPAVQPQQPPAQQWGQQQQPAPMPPSQYAPQPPAQQWGQPQQPAPAGYGQPQGVPQGGYAPQQPAQPQQWGTPPPAGGFLGTLPK